MEDMKRIVSLEAENEELKRYIVELKRKLEEREKELMKYKGIESNMNKFKYKCIAYENVLDAISGLEIKRII